jgi:hypothetical protein
MLSLISFAILVTLVSFQHGRPLKTLSQKLNEKHTNVQTLTLKDAKDLFRNTTIQHFEKEILPRLINGRTMIKINKTLKIPFHAVHSLTSVFPLFLRNVTIRTLGHTNNSSLKIAKIQTALHRLCKLLRHPRVLREIAMRNFSLFGRKKFLHGQKLINMFGSTRLTGGFDIIIKSLKQGKM